MKAIQWNFLDVSKDVRRFVNEELERISPYLEKTIKALYDLNWGEEIDDNSPEVLLAIPFRKGMPAGGPHARVFEFEFYTDSSDDFELDVNEWKDQEEETVARAQSKFSDWLGAKEENAMCER